MQISHKVILRPQCCRCFLEQAVRAACLSTEDDSVRIRAARRAAGLIAALDTDKTPPEIATGIFRAVSEETGNPDGFGKVKAEANRIVAELLGWVRDHIAGSDDRIGTALNAALCGNIIDHGIFDDFDVAALLRKEMALPADKNKIDKLKEIILGSSRISFLADNAGEIGLDGLMLDELIKLNPKLQIAVLVKSGPIINDATFEDAAFFGLDKRFRVYESPATVGVNLGDLTGEAAEAVKNSDWIIAKGQGNYELLSATDPPRTVYLLRAKCAVVAENIGVEINSPVIIIRE